MASKVKSCFDIHSHSYDTRSVESYSHVMSRLSEFIPKSGRLNLLDVGCGNGNFIKAFIKEYTEVHYFATDISLEMLTKAKKNLADNKDGNIELFVADSFKMPLIPDIKFDVIHIASVLHHLIRKTKGKSTSLIKRMVELLTEKLSENGILIVEEIYYNSYVIHNFTSFAIFYGLKLINFLKLDLSRFISQIRPGLEVNFLSEKQLQKMLGQYGSAYLVHKDPSIIPKLNYLLLSKEFGHIEYILKT